MNSKLDFKKFSKIWRGKLTHIALAVAVLALAVSLYNTWEIKTGPVAVGGAKVQSPQKIYNEIPKHVPVLGNPNAKITIIEFGDFQCPYCGNFFKTAYPELKKQYIDTGKAKFIYLNFAFLGQESKDASEALYCAGEQGQYWQYFDALYENQRGENEGAFSRPHLERFGAGLSLDKAKFSSCLDATRYDKLIEAETSLARKYGVTGTPGFIVGNMALKGALPFSDFKTIIEEQLK